MAAWEERGPRQSTRTKGAEVRGNRRGARATAARARRAEQERGATGPSAPELDARRRCCTRPLLGSGMRRPRRDDTGQPSSAPSLFTRWMWPAPIYHRLPPLRPASRGERTPRSCSVQRACPAPAPCGKRVPQRCRASSSGAEGPIAPCSCSARRARAAAPPSSKLGLHSSQG
ncbi:hypothetical protein PVAP13_5KG241940 [Panicum virgatum]|uniref:Uncharacterized protein n=1 Tax=Panicum virgatum TaxID=38727 RepID=A0A8T0SEZ0_PANVG|nr:hypothetical protein PVAP13_5KG241940 [Panicum virgatum]